MKNDLIEKLLNEQTTPEEEHLVAKLLQEEDGVTQWLTEDETQEYDRIVRQRRPKFRLLQWSAAAVLVMLMATGTIVFWPQEQTEQSSNTVVAEKTEGMTRPAILDVEPSVAVTTSAEPVTNTKRVPKVHREQTTVTDTDSLQYYIARLEQELEQVTDSSTYTAKAEQIIRADARLQRLVQRIMIGELTQDNQPQEAMNLSEEE